MSILNSEQVCKFIANIAFKDGRKLVDIVSNIVIKGNDIGFAMDISSASRLEAEEIRRKAISQLSMLPGIGKITIILTSSAAFEKTAPSQKPKQFIENVKKVILVAAGKGGVGKSTIAALIAEQLHEEGYQVGVVDADIYGPSIPQIFGVNEKPEIIDKKMIPLKSRGIQIISIGFLIDAASAIAWRGPMASKAIYQLLSLTAWENLDYLIIDMPPGTGDIHLSILENYQLDGVYIVTIPQKLSGADVKKAIDLYRKFNLPILGIIENMSYYIEENSGKRVEIFKGKSGHSLSEEYNIPFVAQVPILPELAVACDEGTSLLRVARLPLGKVVEI